MSKKHFRIENFLSPADVANSYITNSNDPRHIPDDEKQRFQLMMNEINALKKLVSKAPQESVEVDRTEASETHSVFEENKRLQHELQKTLKIRDEMNNLQKSIKETKHEIATLHLNSFDGDQMERVAYELDAVISNTEKATETILAATEVIDERASNLSASLTGVEADAAHDISEKTIEIYEACNFQDITGQRIVKVIKTMMFVEDRINNMLKIWGGIESFKNFGKIKEQPKNDGTLLNGPSLDSDTDIASQDDIDAFFS